MALDTATIIKGTVGVLGVSGLGVGGYYGIQALNKETIESKLKEEGFEKLSKTSPEWGDIFKSYQAVSTTNTVLKFSGEVVDSSEKLQKRCEEILSKDASEDNTTNNYLNQAKKWCIVPITVEKALEGRKILRTNGEKDDEDQAAWNKKIEDYTKTGNNDKIESLNLGIGPLTGNAIDQAKRQLIKGECKKLNNKKSYEADYDKAVEKSKTWCTLAESDS